MIVLSNGEIFSISSPAELIDALSQAFAEPFESPDRMHCDLPGSEEAKLLVMPAWQGRSAIGVKVATVMPDNSRRGLPTIDGVYVLMDGQTGSPTVIRLAHGSDLGTRIAAHEPFRCVDTSGGGDGCIGSSFG